MQLTLEAGRVELLGLLVPLLPAGRHSMVMR
jgi:hypothetical protein